MNAVGMALVWCVIQVTLLAAVVALVYGVVRKSGPPARALAALAGLILIVALTALTFSPWPRWPTDALRPVAKADQAREQGSAGDLSDRDSAAESPDAAAAGATPKAAQPTGLLNPTAVFFQTLVAEMQRPPAAENESWGWPAYVAILFMIGAGLGLTRLIAGLAAVRSYRLRARPVTDPALRETADVLLAELRGPRGVVLCESELLATPATIGWRRPLIILPADWKSWTGPERRAVLAHEIAHIARHDFPTWVAAQFALVFHFYHPLVHWLAARLRLEQELAADAAAAQVTGGQRSYLTTLAGMALRQSDRPLAWPARTFLPTRGTFMRRIEMLRDENLLSTKLTAGLRAGTIAALAVASLAVAGLRGTAADRKTSDRSAALALADDGLPKTAQDKPRTPRTGSSGSSSSNGKSGSGSTTGTVDPFSLAWVPRDAVAVARIRPAELLNRPALAAVKKILTQQKEIQESLGVAIDRIEQVTMIFLLDAGQPGQPGQPPGEPAPAGIVVRLLETADASAMLKALQPNSEKLDYGGQTYTRDLGGPGQFCLLADDRTVVTSAREEHLRRLIVAGKNGALKAKWAGAWKGADDADVAVLVNTSALSEMMNQVAVGSPPGAPGPAIAPLWQNTTTALLTANFRERLDLSLKLTAKSHEEALKVQKTLTAVVTLGQNSLSQARAQFSRMPGGEGAVLLRAVDTVDTLLDSLKIERAGESGEQVEATATAEVEDAASIVAMLLPAVGQARMAARRAQATNNLKQLALAMHNYADVNKSFPPAVLYGPDGKTPYSWRVALLPYLDQEALFRQYKFDEPWDSPNNKQVLAKMPALFRDPNDPAESTFASYFALTGPSTIFFGKEGSKFSQILDGTSNTIMFVEAKRDIPWTKPEDIPYAADKVKVAIPPKEPGGVAAIGSAYDSSKPLPRLGGHYPNIFVAALCDGSVRTIHQNVDPNVLRALITRDGGEVLDFLQLDNPQPPGRVPTDSPRKPGN